MDRLRQPPAASAHRDDRARLLPRPAYHAGLGSRETAVGRHAASHGPALRLHPQRDGTGRHSRRQRRLGPGTGRTNPLLVVAIKQMYAATPNRRRCSWRRPARYTRSTSMSSSWTKTSTRLMSTTCCGYRHEDRPRRKHRHHPPDVERRPRPRIRKPAEAFLTSKAIIDACKPYEWIKDFPQRSSPTRA